MKPLVFQSISPQRRPVAILIAVNVVIFLLCFIGQLLASRHIIPFSPQTLLGLPSSLTALAAVPWTPLTYMFVHTDILHLIFNMLWLFWFGEIIAAERTPRRTIAVYFAGGLAGAAAYIIFSLIRVSSHTLFGASASILALMAYAAVIAPNFPVRLVFIGVIKLKWIALACTLLAFVGIGGSSLPAHIGGSLAGLIFALPRRHTKPSTPIARFTNTDVRRFKKAAIHSAKSDQERLDVLLDKIRLSGFDSLSPREKEEIKLISRRMENHKQ